jgi:mannose-6-phosphate isomerase-like protein (cupin superfamily)
MAMRLVVTGTSAGGRSQVESAAEVTVGRSMAELWVTSPDEPLGHPGDPKARHLMPPAGGAHWRIVDLPPDEVMRPFFEKGVPHHDSRGFHLTETVDYIFVMEGAVTLELDEGAVDLGPGDMVVQRRTNHAWRNKTGGKVRLLCLMQSLEAP